MAFPTTPILDDFNRANEGPPPSSDWTTVTWADGGLKVLSNAAVPAATATGDYLIYWNTGTFGPNVEARFTVVEYKALTNSYVEIYVLVDDPVNFNVYYWISLEYIFPNVILSLYSNAQPGSLDSATIATPVDGDQWGVEVLNGTVTIYRYPAGGSDWQVELTFADPAPIGTAGYTCIGIQTQSNQYWKLDDFGGGTIATPAPPVADFSATPTSGTVPLSVDFTDLTTNTPTSWYWDFGDGGSSTSQNPTHVYNYIGTYTVNLTATNALGSDIETKVAYITVTAVVEYGPAEVENCDVDTGGASVGLRVADVAIARDNIFGSVTIDASAELRAKDNAYSTLTNNGTLTSLAGDRAVWDTTNFAALHARDIDEATGTYHLVSAVTQTYTISNPSTDRAYDVAGLTLNELAAVVGTLIADLQAKGLLT